MASGYQGILGTLTIPSASNTSSVLLNSDTLDKFNSITFYVSGNALGTLTLQASWTGSYLNPPASGGMPWYNVYAPNVSGISAVGLPGGAAVNIPTLATEIYRFSSSVAQSARVNIVAFGALSVDVKALP